MKRINRIGLFALACCLVAGESQAANGRRPVTGVVGVFGSSQTRYSRRSAAPGMRYTPRPGIGMGLSGQGIGMGASGTGFGMGRSGTGIGGTSMVPRQNPGRHYTPRPGIGTGLSGRGIGMGASGRGVGTGLSGSGVGMGRSGTGVGGTPMVPRGRSRSSSR